MAMRLIWTGYIPANYWDIDVRPLIRGYDDSGNLLYSFIIKSSDWPDVGVPPAIAVSIYPTCIKGDTNRNLYVAFLIQDLSADFVDEVRKFDCYGNELATGIHHYGANVRQIEIDSSGNIYVAGMPVKTDGTLYSYPTSGAHARVPADGYYTLHKFNSSESLLWSVDSGQDYYVGLLLSEKIAIDSNGDVLITYDYGDYGKRLKKLSGTDGSTLWGPIDFTGASMLVESWGMSAGQVTTDSSNNVYCLGFEYTDDYYLVISKYNSSGTYQDKISIHDFQGYNYENPPWFKMDGSNVLHLTTKLGYYKFNSSLVQTFFSANDLIPTPNGSPAIDSDGGIYFGYPGPTGWYNAGQTYYQLQKFTNTTPTATFSWGAEAYWPLPKPNGEWDSFACIDIVENCQHPAIPIKLELGLFTWFGDLTIHAPALPLPLALGVPTFQWDYVGPPLPAVYRCILTGGTGDIELPLANFQCRKTTTGISLAVTCPALTSTQLTAIQSRTAGNILIRRGIRFRDGTEQVDELVRAAFSTLRWDAGSRSASASLAGQSTAPTVNSKTRALQGISYRNLSGGVRRIRCAVDTYLAVGDTADLGGGETLVVAEIVYNISPETALMEIAEEAA